MRHLIKDKWANHPFAIAKMANAYLNYAFFCNLFEYGMKAQDLLRTVETIIKSPLVECYNIGITVNPSKRRQQYRNWTPTWPHFVIVETDLSREQAFALEKELQLSAWQNKRSVLYKKYRADSRDGGHKPSSGGVIGDSYYVYICWGNVGDN